MLGHVSGVQTRILGQNPKALYTNCDNHSLNLCGAHTSNVEPELATFFDAVEIVNVFLEINFKMEYFDGRVRLSHQTRLRNSLERTSRRS